MKTFHLSIHHPHTHVAVSSPKTILLTYPCAGQTNGQEVYEEESRVHYQVHEDPVNSRYEPDAYNRREAEEAPVRPAGRSELV